MINWDLWQTRAENLSQSVKEATENVQGFQNTIQPLLELVGVQKADQSEEEIANGQFGQAANSLIHPTNYSFPIPGIGNVDILWPILIGGSVLLYMILKPAKRRPK